MKTMNLDLCGIRSYQLDLGIKSRVFRDSRLERTLQEIKCSHKEPEFLERTPLTPVFLLLLLNNLGHRSYNEVVIQAAFTLTFASFLTI